MGLDGVTGGVGDVLLTLLVGVLVDERGALGDLAGADHGVFEGGAVLGGPGCGRCVVGLTTWCAIAWGNEFGGNGAIGCAG